MGTPGFKVGVIASAHGVRGQVKIHSFSEDPEDLLRYGQLFDVSGKRRFTLTRHGAKATQLIASIEGITDRNEAEKLKGTELYADASLQEIAENEYAGADLIGLSALTATGETYGKVITLYNFGAGDILEIEHPNGQAEMLPFTSAFFGEVNTAKGHIIVIPPDYEEPGDEDKDIPENG
jgi:16S rRNA processing protein RimM